LRAGSQTETTAVAIVCHPYLANSLGTRGLVARALASGIPVYLIDGEDAEPRRVLDV
jgi:hypothetical protein